MLIKVLISNGNILCIVCFCCYEDASLTVSMFIILVRLQSHANKALLLKVDWILERVTGNRDIPYWLTQV